MPNGWQIHEIVGLREDLSVRTAECLQFYSKGLAFYFEGAWQDAILAFQRAESLEPGHMESAAPASRNPSRVMLERLDEILKNPPSLTDWNGVYIMDHK